MTLPPMGVLQLNFDGSYIQSISIGVIAGIIRDWNDNVCRSFLGPVESSDANEVEVFTLLVGGCELRRMGGMEDTMLFFKATLSW